MLVEPRFRGSGEDKRVVITGASGYVGLHLCRALVESRYQVLGLARSNGSIPAIKECGASALQTPAIQAPDFAESVEGSAFAVVHLAGRVHKPPGSSGQGETAHMETNVAGTRHAAELAVRLNAGVFILTSTLAVYGNKDLGAPIDTATPENPVSAYARSKLLAEEAAASVLMGSSTSLKVLRIPMIYGSESPGNFTRLSRLIDTGLPLPFRGAGKQRSFLYIENLIDAIEHILAQPDKCPPLALIADDEPVSVAEMCRIIISARSSRARLFYMPGSFIKAASIAIGQRSKYESLFESMEIDTSAFRNSLGWSAPVLTSEAIRRAASRGDSDT